MNMNRNKKVFYFIFIVISFFFLTINAYAACSEYGGITGNPTECEKHNENGFQCKGSYSAGIASSFICAKSSNCAQGYTKDGNKCVSSNSNSSNSSGTNSSRANQNVECSSLTDSIKCGYYSKCLWNESNATCSQQQVAESPCTDQRILLVIRFFGYLLLIIKLAIPSILIFFGTFDLLKSVIDKDEKSLAKQVRVLIIRIAIGVFIFFIPAIVKVVFNSIPATSFKASYQTCTNCLLTPGSCSVETLKSTTENSSN